MTSGSAKLVEIRDLLVETPTGFSLEVDELDVRAGEIVAIVGANGSGKTTLIEALLGLRRTVRGRIGILESEASNLRADRRRLRRLGCQLQNNSYGRQFRVGEILSLHKALYGRADPELEAKFGLAKWQRHEYGRLSRGQKQRVDLFVALAHAPELLVLDEPSTGLDRHYLRVFGDMLQQAKEAQTAVIMASHKPEEIELAGRVVVLDRGQIRAVLDMPGDLHRIVGRKRFELGFADELQAEAAAAELASLGGVVKVMRHGRMLKILAQEDLDDRITRRFSGRLASYSFAASDIADLLDATSTAAAPC